MVTTQLVTYIREQQALGRDEETIMKTLIERQWKPQDVKAGFASIGAWNDTFSYVIPGTDETSAVRQTQAVLRKKEPRSAKKGWSFGLALFVVLAVASAATAFYLGRSGGLNTTAPATIPAQVPAASSAPSQAPAVVLPSPAKPDVSF